MSEFLWPRRDLLTGPHAWPGSAGAQPGLMVEWESRRNEDAEGTRKWARHQPPPLVRNRRMKRSCSEGELCMSILSMGTSKEEDEILTHLRNCIDAPCESSMRIDCLEQELGGKPESRLGAELK